jgi:beta-xylosidase-like protein
MIDKTSLFRASGLPDSFGVVLLVFSFILVLSPYFSGADFGVFKIPLFTPIAKRWLKIIGPVAFGICILSFLPILPTGGMNPSTDDSQSSMPKIVGSAFFADDFGGGKLGPKWKVIEEDKKKWSLQSNPRSLLVITQKGSIWGSAKDLKNQFILNVDLPKRNFEVIAKASFQIQNQHNSLSIAVYKDDDNFLEIGYWGQPWGYNVRRVPHFTKEEGSQRNDLFADARGYGGSNSPENFYLKIERDSNQYSGYYSFVETKAPDSIDDIRWTKIGTQAWINFDGKLAFWADNNNAEVPFGITSPEVAAEFDFVLIREK